MLYCKHCHLLCPEVPCPVCGKKDLTPPGPEDYCLLAEQPYLWAEMLEAALRDNGLEPVCDRSVTGAWLTSSLGPMTERCRVYVPFSALEQAKEIFSALFETPEYEE